MAQSNAIGIDLGGTYLRAALVGPRGELRHYFKTESGAGEGPERPLEGIASATEHLVGLAGGSVLGVGVGAPGVVHPRTGAQIGETPHLPHWKDYPLRERVAARLGVPVVTDNDANLAALAEHRIGAARGARVSMMVTIGTGVGCGIVIDGKVLRGGWGGAGEIGHLPLASSDMICRCGVQDCVEPEMSGSGLSRAAAVGGLDAPQASAVFAAAERGDARARELTERFWDRLGSAVAVAVNLLNPDVVVVGGGLIQGGEAALEPLRQSLGRYALASHRRGLKLTLGALGERAGVIGAGLEAWERFGAAKEATPS